MVITNISNRVALLPTGTYKGQWLRGLRHGFGTRQSVAYDIASRLHSPSPALLYTHNHPHPPLPRKADATETLLALRDRRIESHPGGFVLLAETSNIQPPRNRKGLILDKNNRPSLGKTIAWELRNVGRRTTSGI